MTDIPNDDSEDGSRGPFSYENWLAQIQGEPVEETVEFKLYTDARPIGQETGDGLDLGPYELWNTVPVEEGFGLLRPALVLRIEYRGADPIDLSPMDETDVARYHGGSLEDEVAALLSLSLGMRIKPGSVVRSFDPEENPRGRPRAEVQSRIPTLSVGERSPVIPNALGRKALSDAKLLEIFPDLAPRAAISLVRVARSYQEALWISESEPEVAWLFFVTAVEIAANYWTTEDVSEIELLRERKPEIAAILQECEGEALQRIAEEFAPTMQATRKFIKFLLEFLPEAPAKRPYESAQFRWSNTNMKRGLSLIYHYRSIALHGGTPMPLPMCQPPWKHQEWDAPSEVPQGLATRAQGGTWVADDVPMLLHTFEYIVREALLKWWDSLQSGGQD